MVDPVAFTNSTPLVEPPNPLAQLQSWQNLTNSAVQQQIGQQSIVNMKTQNDQATTNLATQRQNRANSIAYSLSILPDDQLTGQAGYDAAAKALSNELANGTITQTQYSTYLANLPPPTQNGQPTSPGTYRQVFAQHLIGGLAGPEAIKTIMGTPDEQNNGQTMQPGIRGGVYAPNGQGGAFKPAGTGTQVQMGPGEAASPGQQKIDLNPYLADGVTDNPNYMRPISNLKGDDARNANQPGAVRAQPLPFAGGGALATPSGPGAVSPTNPLVVPRNMIPPPPGSVTPGRYGIPNNGPMAPGSIVMPDGTPLPTTIPAQGRPDGYRGPAIPNPDQQSQAAPQPSTSALGPAPTEAASIAASGQHQLAQRGYYANPASDVQRQAYNTLNNLLPGVNTGPGTDTLELKKAVIQTLAPSAAKSLGIDPAQVTDRAVVEKNFLKLASSGAGSDAQLAAAIGSSPSGHIDKTAAQKIVAQQLGNLDMERALHFEHDNPATLRTGNYDASIQNHRQQVDQMAFAKKYMPTEDTRRYYNSLDDSGKAKFVKSLELAAKYQRQLTNNGEMPSVRP